MAIFPNRFEPKILWPFESRTMKSWLLLHAGRYTVSTLMPPQCGGGKNFDYTKINLKVGLTPVEASCSLHAAEAFAKLIAVELYGPTAEVVSCRAVSCRVAGVDDFESVIMGSTGGSSVRILVTENK